MRMSINIGLDTLKQNDLNINDFMVLAIIYSYERNNKPCLLKREKMAQYLNLGARTIDRSYQTLKANNYIIMVKGCKKLTAKGILFSQQYFSFKASKNTKINRLSHPKWLQEYKQEIETKTSRPSLSEAENQAVFEAARGIFSDID